MVLVAQFNIVHSHQDGIQPSLSMQACMQLCAKEITDDQARLLVCKHAVEVYSLGGGRWANAQSHGPSESN
jgi:hypothetical protein